MRRRIGRSLLLLVAVLTVGLVVAACGPDDGTDDDDVNGNDGNGAEVSAEVDVLEAPPDDELPTIEMTMEDNEFLPAHSELAAGVQTLVIVRNDGAGSHTFTVPDFDIDVTIGSGGTGYVLITAAGEGDAPFTCTFHSGMDGFLTVVPGD